MDTNDAEEDAKLEELKRADWVSVGLYPVRWDTNPLTFENAASRAMHN